MLCIFGDVEEELEKNLELRLELGLVDAEDVLIGLNKEGISFNCPLLIKKLLNGGVALLLSSISSVLSSAP